MMYQLVIDRYAQKQLGKISLPHFNRIVKAINDLATDPGPIGDYRIIYNHCCPDKIFKMQWSSSGLRVLAPLRQERGWGEAIQAGK